MAMGALVVTQRRPVPLSTAVLWCIWVARPVLSSRRWPPTCGETRSAVGRVASPAALAMDFRRARQGVDRAVSSAGPPAALAVAVLRGEEPPLPKLRRPHCVQVWPQRTS